MLRHHIPCFNRYLCRYSKISAKAFISLGYPGCITPSRWPARPITVCPARYASSTETFRGQQNAKRDMRVTRDTWIFGKMSDRRLTILPECFLFVVGCCVGRWGCCHQNDGLICWWLLCWRWRWRSLSKGSDNGCLLTDRR
jgi:hypothetical protein